MSDVPKGLSILDKLCYTPPMEKDDSSRLADALVITLVRAGSGTITLAVEGEQPSPEQEERVNDE